MELISASSRINIKSINSIKSIHCFLNFSRQRENGGKYSAKVWTIVDIEKLCKSLYSLKCHLKEGDSVKVALNLSNENIFKDISL